MKDLPAPLTPPDANLKPFKDMPFEVARFAKSGLITKEDPEAIVAAILLWGAAWHELPAGSLPDDDKELANLAGYGRAVSAWLEVKKGALRGWVKCSDGRFYHEVVAEKVRECWLARLKQMHRNYGSAVRMHNSRNPTDQRNPLPFEEWNENLRPEGPSRQKPAQQQILPLESEEMLRATDPVSYAQQTPPVTRLKSSKGREGKGREGKGIYIEDVDDAGASGAPEFSDHLCRIAGIRNLEPGRIIANIAQVKEWIDAGADPPMIAEIVQDRRDTATDGIRSLKYFDASILQAVARRDHPANAKRSHNGSLDEIRDPLLRDYLASARTMGP